MSQQIAGLVIEPSWEAPHGLVLRLSTSRFECILELDDDDFVGNGGHLDAVYTLDCWLASLEQLRTGQERVVLLPFNFSDQCIGLLRAGPVRDGLVELQAGWSRVGQYDLRSPDLSMLTHTIRDFEPTVNARTERPLAEITTTVTALRDLFEESRGADGKVEFGYVPGS